MISLHWRVLIGLVVGAALGLIAGQMIPPDAPGRPELVWAVENVAQPIGRVFLNLIFMVVVPLVFSALVLGVAGLGDVRSLGRMGLRTLGYTVLLSGAAVAIALTLTNAIRPGAHLSAEQRAALWKKHEGEAEKLAQSARQPKPVRDQLLDIIPRNPLRELVGATDGSSPGGGMLAVMFFALMIGAAYLAAPARTAPLLGVLEGLFDVSMVIIGWAMWLAPLGVAGLMFALTATLGPGILQTLLWFVLTVLAGLLLQMIGVYGAVLALLARVNPLRFFAATADATVTAFATSSSNATLPTALRVAEQNLKLRPQVGRFVLTIGATANQNGTALYEGVAVLFLAQVFGVELSLAAQASVAFMCILGGIGTAGVPSGSIPFIALVLASIQVPPEAIGIILGVDRVLDMCRTTVNVGGDLVIATCVDRAEGR